MAASAVIQKEADLTAALNSYFDAVVKLTRENIETSVEISRPFIDDILDYVSQKDSRFGNDMVPVGSYWQGLKVNKANEFDVNVVLSFPEIDWNNNSQIWLPEAETGYTYLPVSEYSTSQLYSDLIENGLVVPFHVKKYFKNLLVRYLQRTRMENVEMSLGESGPAITLHLKKAGHHKISIDFAPIIQSKLPFQSHHGWPRQGSKWPSREKIERILQVGINLVGKKDIQWRLSFSECERELVKEIDSDRGCRKKCHRIMKSLLHDTWCPEPKPVLSSYIVKNVWFWECEKYPNWSSWKNEHLWIRFRGLTESLLYNLKKRNVRLFFYPEVNLLKHKDESQLDIVARRINAFLNKPEPILRRC